MLSVILLTILFGMSGVLVNGIIYDAGFVKLWKQNDIQISIINR
jgi:hypothetical protein